MNFYTDDISNGYNWKGLERAIARLMGHLGWKDITVIGGAGDRGGDVLATRAEGNQIKDDCRDQIGDEAACIIKKIWFLFPGNRRSHQTLSQCSGYRITAETQFSVSVCDDQ